MKIKAAFPLAFAAVFLLAALSTGSTVLWMIAMLLFLSLLLGGCSVLWAAGTLRLCVELADRSVFRGQSVSVGITVRHRGLIPIAPLALELSAPGTEIPSVIRLRDIPGKEQRISLPFAAAHVGVFRVGVRAAFVEDLMGFFQRRKAFPLSAAELLVLPASFEVDSLPLSPGDPGNESVSRASEDLSAPSDIRAYQPGDPMKKIHWKLSLRKGELLVRTFDEPILREALILMDCSRPPSWGHPEAAADVRDALLETAASVFSHHALTDLSLHLPLFGAHPAELDKAMGLPLILENLARADFSETTRFENVLLLESRRLRKVGCLVIITARLNSVMVDILSRMRHPGPCIRLYLVTFAPEDPRVLPLIARLQQSDIEVAYVTPDHGAPAAPSPRETGANSPAGPAKEGSRP